MPKRTDIHSILILGSGPIVIGQACEFDYSGVQACKVLRSMGYKIILLNSNPATIMTDPDMADVTYVEPLTPLFAEQVIARERPDAILATVGGQTALNFHLDLHKEGILDKYDVELIGAKPEVIHVAEDRQAFKECMIEHGIPVAPSGIAHTLKEAEDLIDQVGLPAIIRPSFTLGGHGGGIAYNMDEYRNIIRNGLDLSPISQVLVERSALGWKEYEFELMRDNKDNVIIVCSIENFDPMGVHTGDSITVAPSQTLTDKEFQVLRDASLKIMRAVGVETGGSNIQFSVNPENGEYFVIEMNPRVSRSSALASKATGFPIAKIAAQLAIGMTLDEIDNDITRETPACFEPTLDYVVVKIPRWNFEKFNGASRLLGTQMKSVGEVMSLGGTFSEALQKALQSLEWKYPTVKSWTDAEIKEKIAIATPDRLPAIIEGLERGIEIDEIHALTKIDMWFLQELRDLYQVDLKALQSTSLEKMTAGEMKWYKGQGFSDAAMATALNSSETEVRATRKALGVTPVFKRVDTCAGEFESYTPYLYSTYADENESTPMGQDSVVVIGNGPNRIGQGIEFDYCCCHAAMAIQDLGYKAIMVNCNPETVSTDYDTSDKLFFEPITVETIQTILDHEKPKGVVIQFGGQTPLKLSHSISPILGTEADVIDLCEDRQRFNALLERLHIRQPKGAMVHSKTEAQKAADDIGFPLLVRPSYVLGGRGMKICYGQKEFDLALDEALDVSEKHPVLIDQYLEMAMEYDVDALCDGDNVLIAGIMEHIEEAGVHSGDSSCVIPPVYLAKHLEKEMIEVTKRIALDIGVTGVVNIQFAIKDATLYVIEVNPRASRTLPFVSKAKGISYAKIATGLCLGKKLTTELTARPSGKGLYFIKTPVFPWQRFDIDDVALSPEMRSTGEVMGVGRSFGEAYAKALIGAGMKLPLEGGVFLSVRDQDKGMLDKIAGPLYSMGYRLYATRGTHKAISDLGIPCTRVNKVGEGRPNIVDDVRNGSIQLMINTPLGQKSIHDEAAMRLAGLRFGIPCITTFNAALAAVQALRSLRAKELRVIHLQEMAQF